MNESLLITFAEHHWTLLFLFVVLAVAVIVYEQLFSQGAGLYVSTSEVIQLINREDGVVIDIRDKDVFKKGHVVNALNISASAIEKQLKKMAEHQAKPIIVVCGQGLESLKIAEIIRKKQFDRVKVLKGGMQAWREAGLPLEKGGA
jgi:rhodanese-related sulfurtransferase